MRESLSCSIFTSEARFAYRLPPFRLARIDATFVRHTSAPTGIPPICCGINERAASVRRSGSPSGRSHRPRGVGPFLSIELCAPKSRNTEPGTPAASRWWKEVAGAHREGAVTPNEIGMTASKADAERLLVDPLPANAQIAGPIPARPPEAPAFRGRIALRLPGDSQFFRKTYLLVVCGVCNR